jgi:PAS domain S-box-containing protein
VGYLVLDPMGVILEANLMAARLLGFERSALRQHKLSHFIVHAEREAFERHCEEVFATGTQQICELELVVRGSTPLHVRLQTIAIQGEDGIRNGCRMAVTDITERKRTEAERNELLQSLGKRVKELTSLYRLASSIRERETLEEIFLDVAALIPAGWHYPEIARGKVYFKGGEFVSEPFEETEWRQVSDILVNGQVCGSVEVYYMEPRPDLDDGPFLKEERHVIDGIAAALSEAIERRQADAALEQAKAAAEAASRSKSRFLANMSHEIRTPMTPLLGFVELLRNEDLTPEERRSYIDIIHRNGKHLLTIINGILDLSKIESGQIEIERVPCSPLQIVGDLYQSLKERAEDERLAFDVRYVGPIPTQIESDPTRIREILWNLLTNAIKFTETGGVSVVVKLEGEVEAREARLQFEIADTGPGLAASVQQSIFEPFVQLAASSKRKLSGSGLGLSISRTLAELLGGSLRLRSQLGRGSTFTLTIPTGPLKGVEMAKDYGRAVPDGDKLDGSDRTQPGRFSGHVLLAEDVPDTRHLMRKILHVAGLDVEEAENGRIAVEKAKRAGDEGDPFDVILMDMWMPEMDGYAATSRRRAQGCEQPIIAVTAHAMTEERDRCLASGCDHVLTKPVSEQALFELLGAYLSPRSSRATSKRLR